MELELNLRVRLSQSHVLTSNCVYYLYSLANIQVQHEENGHKAVVRVPPMTTDDLDRTGKVKDSLQYLLIYSFFLFVDKGI